MVGVLFLLIGSWLVFDLMSNDDDDGISDVSQWGFKYNQEAARNV